VKSFVKSKTAKLALFGVLAFTLVVGIGFAVAEDGPMHHHGMHDEFMGGPGMGFLMHELNLTEEQHAQIKQIIQNEKGTIHPLMQQEFQAHQQMMQLITSGSFDETKATTIASQEAQTHMQMEVEHAKIGSQIYQLLSADQKAKVADLMAKHQQRMQEHMQNHEQPAPPAQQ
jgi:periplasmic protein CpxP/Spy